MSQQNMRHIGRLCGNPVRIARNQRIAVFFCHLQKSRHNGRQGSEQLQRLVAQNGALEGCMNVLRAAAGMHQSGLKPRLGDNQRLVANVHLGASASDWSTFFSYRLHGTTELRGLVFCEKALGQIR